MSQPVLVGNGDVGFTSGTQFATDNVAGVEYPISKIDVGGVGASALLSAANPMPSDVSDRAGRLLGVLASITAAIDVGDRAARILGHVTVDNFPATQPVSAAALPLPANAAQEAGGNLAVLVAKDFATSVKQDANVTAIQQLDTDLLAAVGTASAAPAAYTLLDRLKQNGVRLEALANKVATESTMQKLLAALSKPASKQYATLLHR